MVLQAAVEVVEVAVGVLVGAGTTDPVTPLEMEFEWQVLVHSAHSVLELELTIDSNVMLVKSQTIRLLLEKKVKGALKSPVESLAILNSFLSFMNLEHRKVTKMELYLQSTYTSLLVHYFKIFQNMATRFEKNDFSNRNSREILVLA